MPGTNPGGGASGATVPIDASECAREPIHVPGAVQPHGAFVAARAGDLVVTHASANLAAVLGIEAASALGQGLSAVIGDAAGFAQAAIGQPPATARSVPATGANGARLRVGAHESGPFLCVDIEPDADGRSDQQGHALQGVLETFTHAATPSDLCRRAVAGLRALTGHDRAFAYCFDADGHGEVIAESCRPDLEPYLGLHYPAGDFPAQARALALRQRTASIADVGYEPVPILALNGCAGAEAIDLTYSALRSVSPLHRQYLRNMGVGSSFAISILQGCQPEAGGAADQALWGMLVCHHATPRYLDHATRSACALVGQVVSLLLRSIAEADAHATRLRFGRLVPALAARLAAVPWDEAAVAAAGDDLLRIVGAAGALLRFGGKATRLGRTPPLPQAEHALALLHLSAGGRDLALDNLALAHPVLDGCRQDGSGALYLPAGPDGDDAILWFRPERVRTVTWGGDPDKHVGIDPGTGMLCPRASFAAWKQIVYGRSVPWTRDDRAIAAALRLSIESAIAERAKSDLARLRYYDPLTGLPNRSLLQDRLQELQTAPDGKVALLFLDLDRFKAVNDTMGHAAGDALLKEVAARLRATVRAHDLPARLGGDEFVVLCPGLDRDAAAALGESVRAAIEAPFDIDGRLCHVSASIGIAVGEQSGGIDLIRAADMAMYSAKQSGGNKEVVFESALFDHASMQFDLEQDMRAALAAGDQFVLLYQPLFAVAPGGKRLAGFEALVRWRHPRRGWMSPALFIQLAEKSGMILPLGDWVLATGLVQGKALRAAHPDADIVMNINISAAQLRPGFANGVADALAAEGFPPTALCLEVTESMLTDATAAAALAGCRALGAQVAIDDFGVGYSSLSYLRRLPVDVVKLDRSFLEGVEGDPKGEGFVGAVIALAHAAGKPVVFEGIETQGQYDIAAAAGADLVQGFLFAPPLSFHAAMELVGQHRLLDAHLAKPPRAGA